LKSVKLSLLQIIQLCPTTTSRGLRTERQSLHSNPPNVSALLSLFLVLFGSLVALSTSWGLCTIALREISPTRATLPIASSVCFAAVTADRSVSCRCVAHVHGGLGVSASPRHLEPQRLMQPSSNVQCRSSPRPVQVNLATKHLLK
jgi:hypothetical protein